MKPNHLFPSFIFFHCMKCGGRGKERDFVFGEEQTCTNCDGKGKVLFYDAVDKIIRDKINQGRFWWVGLKKGQTSKEPYANNYRYGGLGELDKTYSGEQQEVVLWPRLAVNLIKRHLDSTAIFRRQTP